ncbi:MAG: tyrosine-type recombinase/integrase [Phycisphaerae bacterium]|nr:tyrosine-type recombinase/integrase [Phycisphaerae bacterium]
MASFNWTLAPDKFLTNQQAEKLLETAKINAKKARLNGNKIPIRDYFIIDLALSTGLRVMEMAQLNCGDIFLEGKMPAVFVKNGKGKRKRIVRFNGAFKMHCKKYLSWKQYLGEPIEASDPLFLSSNTGRHMTVRAIQKVFKKIAAKAGLPSHYSIHCLRHTYASQLYKASGYNLRLVQKQLGHSNSRTTEVYADVLAPDVQSALEGLYRL